MVVPGVGAAVTDREVVEAMADMVVEDAGLLPPPSPRPPPAPRVSPRSTPRDGSSPRLSPDEPALSPNPKLTPADSETPRVAETLALRIGLPDGPRTTPPPTPAPTDGVASTSMQPLRMLPPFEQVAVPVIDGNKSDNDGMMVVADKVGGRLPPGRSEDRMDETPSSTVPAT